MYKQFYIYSSSKKGLSTRDIQKLDIFWAKIYYYIGYNENNLYQDTHNHPKPQFLVLLDLPDPSDGIKTSLNTSRVLLWPKDSKNISYMEVHLRKQNCPRDPPF